MKRPMEESLLARTEFWRASLNRLIYYLTLPQVIISLTLIALLFFLAAIPFLKLLQETVTWQFADIRISRLARPGGLTLFHWKRVLASNLSPNIFYQPFLRSLETSLSIGILAVVLGSLMAWLVVRTDMPGKRFISAMAVAPYVLPSYTLALAWLNFFRTERIGGGIGAFKYLFGFSPPEWLAYGYIPIVITLSLHYYPFTYLLVSGALISFDAHLEEAGEVLGARRWHILRRITLPLVLPAILSAFILTFSRALGTFGTPYFLGAPIRYFTLSTMIYSSIISRTFATGYILASILIFISILIIGINQRIIGARKGFVTVTGRGFRSRVTPLGKGRYPAFFAMMAIILIAVFIPLSILVWQTFMLYPDDYSFRNLTLHYWIGESDPVFAEGEQGVLRNSLILGAVWNSIKLSVLVALITGMMGIFIGYGVVKGRGTFLSRFLEQQAFLPYLIPSIAFGAIYLSIFTRSYGPLPALYGTFLILVMVCVSKNIPFAARAGISSALQVAGELEEAAVVAGASWFKRFGRILLPLTFKGSLSGFILTFIATMRELSLIILLVTPTTRTLTTMTFRYTEQGYSQFADALILIIVVLVLAGDFMARRLGRVEAH